MIQKFVDKFMNKKSELEKLFTENQPESYAEIVETVIATIQDNNEEEYYTPDVNRIHEIDDGHRQGTLLYVIGVTGYQPSVYWYVKVDYGSCSSSDTLQNIESMDSDEERVKDYMTLALHVVQSIKLMGK